MTGLQTLSQTLPAQAMKHLLVVDDDSLLRQSLVEQLRFGGEFEVSEAADAAAADQIMTSTRIDAVLLDVGLPDQDGRALCQQWRKRGYSLPILMLTAADGERDTIAGLDAGANDYIPKPFRFGELLARLRAHIRQYEQSEHVIVVIGPYDFQPAAKLLRERDGKQRKLRLTEKEVAILKYLYRAGGRTIGRDQLLGEVWGYNQGVTTHTLETHIYRLRQKIEPDPSRVQLLITEAGGYRLNL